MSDTVALALIALIGAINLTVSGLTHHKVRKCGDRDCQAQISSALPSGQKNKAPKINAEASNPL